MGQPSLREAQKQLTHTRLLDAAVELFASRGYAATTIEDIATYAGATRATFYLHFPSKRNVALGLRDAVTGDAPDYAELALAPDTARDWLRRYVVAREDRRLIRAALHDAARADSVVGAELDADAHGRVRELAGILVALRGWDPGAAEVTAAVLHDQLDVLDDGWVLGRCASAQEVLLETLARMWCAALSAPALVAQVAA